MYFTSAQTSIRPAGTTTVTLLLRANHMAHFGRSTLGGKTRQGIVLYNLLRAHGAAVASGPRSESPRTRYQPVGLGLVRVNVKVDAVTWARIQIIARGLGVSACVVVNSLLAMDAAPGPNGGVPTKRMTTRANTRIRLRVSWEIEMTRSNMIRAIYLGMSTRDREKARKQAAVRAHQRAWGKRIQKME